MATVFMQFLEQRPRTYARGMAWLTFGGAPALWEALATWVTPGQRVLDLGCGPGVVAVRLAQMGAEVVAVDASPAMLRLAAERAARAGVQERLTLRQADLTHLARTWDGEGGFDLIVLSLTLSELPPEEQGRLLRACRRWLRPGGRLLLADEVPPKGGLPRAWWRLLRAVWAPLTRALTGATTHPLPHPTALLNAAGWQAREVWAHLASGLRLFVAEPLPAEGAPRPAPPPPLPAEVPVLRRRFGLREALTELWGLAFRLIPPYPKVKPGLYAIGHPTPEAPLLVTGNFALTVRRVVAALDGRVDAWLLVVDSAGINVWCAAGGGFLTAEKVLAALEAHRVAERLAHRRLILPQLAAAGVDGKVLQAADWAVHWGPVRAEDLPAYLARGMRKTAAMRRVTFPWPARLVMATNALGLYGLALAVVALLFHPTWAGPAFLTLAGLTLTYALLLPYLPGRDGLAHSVPLALLALTGMLLHAWASGFPSGGVLFRRALGMVAAALFSAGEFQGMTPIMRGEQANWLIEFPILAGLGALAWLSRLLWP